MSRQDRLQQWLDAEGALDVLDWRLVEQPSDQYPQGRWEAQLEYLGGHTDWRLAHPDVLPGED